jgi:hypothetical protein
VGHIAAGSKKWRTMKNASRIKGIWREDRLFAQPPASVGGGGGRGVICKYRRTAYYFVTVIRVCANLVSNIALQARVQHLVTIL